MKKLLSIFLLLTIVFGCAKAPEKTNVEDLYNEIENELCGNGTIEAEEECDFKGTKSCSEYNSDLIGPYKCFSCKNATSECIEEESCSDKRCSGNGMCVEGNNYWLSCECHNNYVGHNCSICAEDYHFDLDNVTCISNSICTEIGCDNERKYCYISDKQAYCECKEDFLGENCDVCNDNDYYYYAGECHGKFCSNSNLNCLENYEVCDDYSTYPKCVCKSKTQDPNDCTKCIKDYDWIQVYSNSKECINVQIVECVPDPNQPENSETIVQKVNIYYTDENGWTKPDYCKWECKRSAYLENGLCNRIYLDNNGTTIDSVSVEKNNDLILFRRLHGDIYRLSETNLETINNIGTFQLDGARILPDGNYFYLANESYGADRYIFLKTPEGKEIMKIFPESKEFFSTLTFSNKGRIFYGDLELTFPFVKKTHPDIEQSSLSVTLIDDQSNTYTITSKGDVYSSLSDGTARWKYNFEDSTLSLNSAVSSENLIYIPFFNNLNQGGVYIINTNNGEIIKTVSLGPAIEAPSLSIGKNHVFCSTKSSAYGYFFKITRDGEIIKSIETSTGSTFPPVLLDNNKIYNSQGHLFAFYDNLDIVWDRGSGIKSIFHYNNMIIALRSDIYFYNAPGKPEGDWPQYLHDSMHSGSLEKIKFINPPKAPVIISPAGNSVFTTNSVTFTWEIDSETPEIKYTLLLREPGKEDIVFAGPEAGLSTVTITGLKESVDYEWRVVSQTLEGGLNVSESRTFRISPSD